MSAWKTTAFEADIEIFRPLFSKTRFPKLTYLGIVNSEEQDEIVKMFLESDILPQLETMDISAGVLKDEGAQLLLDNMDKIAHLKFINMRYNYLSKGMKKPAGCNYFQRKLLRQYRIILSADTASEVRQLLGQKRR